MNHQMMRRFYVFLILISGLLLFLLVFSPGAEKNTINFHPLKPVLISGMMLWGRIGRVMVSSICFLAELTINSQV